MLEGDKKVVEVLFYSQGILQGILFITDFDVAISSESNQVANKWDG